MLARKSFLAGSLSILATGAFAHAAPSPKASPTPFPWDMCEQNPVLPYDRPLGLKMRVLDGPDFDLTKYRGYSVILNIFATWCPPCNAEMPALVAAASKYHGRGLRIVGIDYRETDDTVRAFRKKYAIPYPIAMDQHGGFTDALEVGMTGGNLGFPVSLYITPQGYLYCDARGASKDPTPELTYRIDKFLKEVGSTTSQ